MHRYASYAVVAVVLVALLSVGANAAVERSDAPAPSTCGTVELWVSNVDDEADNFDGDVQITPYEDLSTDAQAAFDRARESADPVPVDTDLAVESQLTNRTLLAGGPYLAATLVRFEGTLYHVMPRPDDCPLVAGLPRQLNLGFAALAAIYRVFSPLYLPGGVVLGVVVAYRRVDDWLRFG